MNTIDITVIIPVYNVEAYVEACLHSVMDQEHPDLGVECIIVDDCGSDRSMDVVRRVLASYKGDIPFRIIEHTQNSGLSAARNSGIRAAKGRYITFLDSDDRLLPSALVNMYRLAIKYPEVDIVQGEIQLDKPDKGRQYLSVSAAELPEYIADRNTAKRAILFDIPVVSCSKLIRRDFILSNDLLFTEGMIHEDDMWVVCASQYIETIACCFIPVYYYNNDLPNSIMGNPDKTRSFSARMLILRKAADLFNKSSDKIYYDYILRSLDISSKAHLWPDVSDKNIAKQAMTDMRRCVDAAKCRPLSIAARYFSLPISIGNSKFIRPFYRRIFNIYLNRYSRKTFAHEEA